MLQPAEFMADFEAGLRKAINDYYPDALLRGCWYHYCAAIRRRLMTLQMYRIITEDEEGATIYRMMLCLPLLPPQYIYDGFKVVKSVARDNHLHKEFKKFFDYFEDFWMNMVRLLSSLLLLFYLQLQKNLCCCQMWRCAVFDNHH